MNLYSVGNTSTNYNNQNSSTTGSTKDLGKDDFLQLMIAQMKYQDPLAPTTNTEFISQTAQFNSLEQMTNLNEKTDSIYASSLIGKEVEWTTKKFKTGEGTVEEVEIIDGAPVLKVGENKVQIDELTNIL